MPLDPIRVEDTRAWLSKAAKDLRSVDHGLTASPPLSEDVLFHCQQSVEKVLKGFLTHHDIPFRKTHSLEEIGEQCLKIDSTLSELVDRTVTLTEYAWKFRYPGGLDEPTDEEVQQAVRTAHELYDAILARLPAEVSL